MRQPEFQRRGHHAVLLCLMALFAMSLTRYAHAQVLNPNGGSVTGTLTAGVTDSITYSYTITADTDTTLTLTDTGGVAATVRLYDTDGTSQIAALAATFGGSINLGVGHLGPGVYSVRVTRDNGSGNFTLVSRLTPPAAAKDNEPNDTAAQANAKPILPTQATGHLGYSRTSYGDQDNADWYRFIPGQDEDATFIFTASSSLAATIRFYDQDGTSQVTARSIANGTTNMTVGHLGAGATYYVAVTRDAGYGGYTLNTTVAAPGAANDSEPDNDPGHAKTFALNATTTGHLGYSRTSYGDVDTVDWYTYIPAQDGDIAFTLSNSPGLAASVRFYDVDGTSQIGANSAYYGDVTLLYIGHLAQGATYYVAITRDGNYGTYSLANTVLPNTVANDIEPDDDPGHAKALTLGGSTTGHLGYSRSAYGDADIADWYTYTPNQDGDVTFTLATSGGLAATVRFFDQDGSSQITATSAGYGGTTVINVGHLAQGARYYVEVTRDSQYGSYTLSNVTTPAALTNDKENNDNAIAAKNFPALTAKTTGHLGYSRTSYGDLDNADWYTYTASQDGDAYFTLTLTSSLAATVRFYDQDGTSQITANSAGYGGTAFMGIGHLAPGATYFVAVTRDGQYGSYTLTPQLIPTGVPNDPEVNDDPTQASTNLTAGGTVKGHLGYSRTSYGDLDNYDWYAFTVPQDGDAYFTLDCSDGLAATVRFYDSDGTSQITNASADYGNSVTIGIGHLAPGATYFVAVTRNAQYGTYTLSSTFVPQTALNDVENNDGPASAHALTSLSNVLGHLGYSRTSYNNVDTQDWYKITLAANTSQNINFVVGSSLNATLRLFDSDGTSQIANISASYGSVPLAINNTTSAPKLFYLAVTLNAGYGNYGLNPLPVSTLSGVITLDSLSPSAPAQLVTFKFTPTDGSTPFTQTIGIDATGVYSIPNLPHNIYNVSIKGAKWLRFDQNGVNLLVGDGSLSAFLPGGDADNNNLVDIGDFGILVGAYGSSVSDTGVYDPRADFNVDGLIDINDFGVLVNNYNLQGDP